MIDKCTMVWSGELRGWLKQELIRYTKKVAEGAMLRKERLRIEKAEIISKGQGILIPFVRRDADRFGALLHCVLFIVKNSLSGNDIRSASLQDVHVFAQHSVSAYLCIYKAVFS